MTSPAFKQPTLRLIFSALLAFVAAFASTTGAASAATSAPDAPWSATGTGTTVSSDGTNSDPSFSYAVNGQPLNATGTWTFRATAKTEHTQTIKWHYTGNHGRTGVRVKLELFVISNGHETPFNALPEIGPSNVPSGGFDYSGQSQLRLRVGDVYGVRVSGANTDPEARLTGTVALTLPDGTAPTVTPEITGRVGDRGWYTSDVNVHWNIQDPESEITSTSGCQDATLATDTLGITYACTVVSAGGTTTSSVTIKRDTAPPAFPRDADPSLAASWMPLPGWAGVLVLKDIPESNDALTGTTSSDCGPLPRVRSRPPATLTITCTPEDAAGNLGDSRVFWVNATLP